MSIAIIGGTGTIGSHVVRILTERGHAPSALVRTEAGAAAIRAVGAEPWSGDLGDPDAVRHFVADASTVFLLTGNGPDQVRQEVGVIDAVAATSNAPIVKISVPAPAADSPFEIGRVHHAIEQHLIDAGGKHVIVRPGWLMQNTSLVAAGVAERDELVLPIGEGAVAAVDARDVALVCARLLEDPGSAPSDLTLIGAADVTGASMAEGLTTATGRSIGYRDGSLDEFRATLVADGTPDASADELGMLYDVVIRNGFLAGPSNIVSDLTGEPPHTFDDFAAAHLDWFTRR